VHVFVGLNNDFLSLQVWSRVGWIRSWRSSVDGSD